MARTQHPGLRRFCTARQWGTRVAPSAGVRSPALEADMDAIVRTDLLPSALHLAIAAGTIVIAVGALLLQKAARILKQEQRCNQLRKRVARVDARWHEATM